jgi:hypothetical protein
VNTFEKLGHLGEETEKAIAGKKSRFLFGWKHRSSKEEKK